MTRGRSSPWLRDQSLNADESLEFDVCVFVRHQFHDSSPRSELLDSSIIESSSQLRL